MTNKEDLERLNRVVAGRSRIQLLAYELLRLMHANHGGHASVGMTHNTYDILVGATFSLWRAIFLADGISEWDSVLTNAETFLEKLVRDNAIGYLDDWKSKDWSFMYYLNNARSRLKELTETSPKFRNALEEDGLSKNLESPVVGSFSLSTWDWHCAALSIAIRLLELDQISEKNNGT